MKSPYREVMSIVRTSNGYILSDVTAERPVVSVYQDTGEMMTRIRLSLDAMEDAELAERRESGPLTLEQIEALETPPIPDNVLTMDRPRGPFPTDDHPHHS